MGVHRLNTLLFSKSLVQTLLAQVEATNRPEDGTLREALKRIVSYPASCAGSTVSESCGQPAPDLRPFASPAAFRSFLVDVRDFARFRQVEELGTLERSPMVIGRYDDFSLSFFAFEILMASRPAQLYEAVWYGQLDATRGASGTSLGSLASGINEWTAEFESYFEEGSPLAGEPLAFAAPKEQLGEGGSGGECSGGSPSCVETESPVRNWKAAVAMVAEGRALVTPMGDFAVGYATWLHEQLGARIPEADPVIAVPFPGPDEAGPEPFAYTVDTFAFPRDEGASGHGARQFITLVLADPDTLLQFANAKGALPPLATAEVKVSDLVYPHQREGYQKFARGEEGRVGEPSGPSGVRLLLGLSGVAPPPGVSPRADSIGRYMEVLAFRSSSYSRTEARTNLRTILAELSSAPYAESCRSYGASP